MPTNLPSACSGAESHLEGKWLAFLPAPKPTMHFSRADYPSKTIYIYIYCGGVRPVPSRSALSRPSVPGGHGGFVPLPPEPPTPGRKVQVWRLKDLLRRSGRRKYSETIKYNFGGIIRQEDFQFMTIALHSTE